MAYQTLYRKYRPKTFELVFGQDTIVRTLKNVIKNEKLSHAYLFTGPRGTGKTSSAKLFAKAINCLNNKDGDACNECENCKSFNENSNPDIIEIDAASNNGVDEIREIKTKEGYKIGENVNISIQAEETKNITIENEKTPIPPKKEGKKLPKTGF